MSAAPDLGATVPGEVRPSPKSYVRAVILSSVLGFAGAQHFYLGRWVDGLVDVGLTLGWLVSFAAGHAALGILLLLADLAHAFTMTILLLVGRYKDGRGRVVCYPGQRLRQPQEVRTTWKAP